MQCLRIKLFEILLITLILCLNGITNNVKQSQNYSKTMLYHNLNTSASATINRTRYVLLWTQIRSGSRIVGRLLTLSSASFYTEEPFMNAGEFELINQQKFLKDIMNCQFHNYPQYYESRIQFYHLQNKDTYKISQHVFPSMTSQLLEFDTALCKSSQIRVARIVIPSLKLAFDLIKHNPDLNIQVIYLVRDPRALQASRENLYKYYNATLLDHRYEKERPCQKMKTDLSWVHRIQKHFPKRLLIVRFEDVALRPKLIAKKMFKFLNFSYNIRTDRFISDYTQSDVAPSNPYGMRRNSKAKALGWRKSLAFSQVLMVQENCTSVMKHLGYRIFQTKEEFVNQELSAIEYDDMNQFLSKVVSNFEWRLGSGFFSPLTKIS